MDEIWNKIEDWPDYQISNFGRIKSLKFNKERILKHSIDKRGYKRVVLRHNGEQKTFQVHKLVAIAFIPNPNNLTEINHKNENPSDNNVNNLEWCDRYYNNNYGTHNERVAKAKTKKVEQYTLDGRLVKVWESATEIMNETGINKTCISACARGICRKSHGFIWKYAA